MTCAPGVAFAECEVVRRIADANTTDFVALRGPGGDDISRTTLAEFAQCEISREESYHAGAWQTNGRLLCSVYLEGRASAEALDQRTLASLRQCLGARVSSTEQLGDGEFQRDISTSYPNLQIHTEFQSTIAGFRLKYDFRTSPHRSQQQLPAPPAASEDEDDDW